MARALLTASDYLTFTKAFTSVSAFSCAIVCYIEDTTSTNKTMIGARADGSPALIAVDNSGNNRFVANYNDTPNEYNYNGGPTPITRRWTMTGTTFATGTPGTENIYHAVMYSGSLLRASNTTANLSAISPATFRVGQDSFDSANRCMKGRYAELCFEAAVWPPSVFMGLANGYPIWRMRPTAYWAPLRDDLILRGPGIAPITINGACPPTPHPEMRGLRRDWYDTSAPTSPPPPPPSTYQGARFQMPGVSIFSGRAA